MLREPSLEFVSYMVCKERKLGTYRRQADFTGRSLHPDDLVL